MSLLALVGDDREVLQAHNEAVIVALRYLEATTARARIKHDGNTSIETTGNWIIAIDRYFALMMDRMVGPDFEPGLANLKALAER